MSEVRRTSITSNLYTHLRTADKDGDGKITGAQEKQALREATSGYHGNAQEQAFLNQVNSATSISYTETAVSFVEITPLTLDSSLRDVKGDLRLHVEDINGFSDRGKDDLSGTVSGSIRFDRAIFDRALSGIVGTQSGEAKIKSARFDSGEKAYIIGMEASHAVWGLIPTWDNFEVRLKTDDAGRFYLAISDNWYPDDDIMNGLENAIRDNLKGIDLTIERQGTRLYILPDIKGFKLPISEDNQPSIDKIRATTSNTRVQVDGNGNITMQLTNVPVSGSSGNTSSHADRAKDTADLSLKFGIRFDNNFNVQGQEYLLDGDIHMDIEQGEMPDLGAETAKSVEKHLGQTGQINIRNIQGKISYQSGAWRTQVNEGQVDVRSDQGAQVSARIRSADVRAQGEGSKTRVSSRNVSLEDVTVNGRRGRMSADQVSVDGELGKDATIQVDNLDTDATFGDVHMDASTVDATIRQTKQGTTVTLENGRLDEFKKGKKARVTHGTFSGTIKMDSDYNLSDVRLKLQGSDIRFDDGTFGISGHAHEATLQASDGQNMSFSLDRATVNTLKLDGSINQAEGLRVQGTDFTIRNGKLQDLSIRRFDGQKLGLSIQDHQLQLSNISQGALTYSQNGANVQFSVQSTDVDNYTLDGLANLQGRLENFSGQVIGENVQVSGDMKNIAGHLDPMEDASVDLQNINGHMDYRGDRLRFDVESGHVENVKLDAISDGSADIGKGYMVIEGSKVTEIHAEGIQNLDVTATSDGRTAHVQNGQGATIQLDKDGNVDFSLQKGKAELKGDDVNAKANVSNVHGRMGDSITFEGDFENASGNAQTPGGTTASGSEASGHVNVHDDRVDFRIDSATMHQASHTAQAGTFTVSGGRIQNSTVSMTREGSIREMDVQVEQMNAQADLNIGAHATAEQLNGQVVLNDDGSMILRARQGDLRLEQGEQKVELSGVQDSELNIQADGQVTYRAHVDNLQASDTKYNLSGAGQGVELQGTQEQVTIKANEAAVGINDVSLSGEKVEGTVHFNENFSYEGQAETVNFQGNNIHGTLHGNTVSGDLSQADVHSENGRFQSQDAAQLDVHSGPMDTRVQLGKTIDLATTSREGTVSASAQGLKSYFDSENANDLIDMIESKRIEARYKDLTVSGLNQGDESAMPENVSVTLVADRIDTKLGDISLNTTLMKQGERFYQTGTINLQPDQGFFKLVEEYLESNYGITVDKPLRLENGKLVMEGSKGAVTDLGMSFEPKGDRLELNVDEAKLLWLFGVRGAATNKTADSLNASLIEFERMGQHKLSIAMNDMIPGENLQVRSARIENNQLKVDFEYIDTPEFNASEAVRQRFQNRLERTLFRSGDNDKIEDIAEDLSSAKLKEIFRYAHPNQLHRMLFAVGKDYDNIVNTTLEGDRKQQDLKKYPVENRAIMASYLANNSGAFEKVDDDEEYMLIRLLNSLDSGEGDKFVATLNHYELERMMKNIPDNDEDYSDDVIYSSITHLYSNTRSPFRRLQILQAIATGMDDDEQIKAMQRIWRIEDNPYVFQLARQQKWYKEVDEDARRYFN